MADSSSYSEAVERLRREKEELAEVNARLAAEKLELERENAKLKAELKKAHGGSMNWSGRRLVRQRRFGGARR